MSRAPGTRIPDSDLALLARSAGGLAVVGASLALAIAALHVKALPAFVSANVLSPAARGAMLLWAAAGLLVGLAAAVALYWPRRRSDGVARVSRAARLAAPLALVGLVPGLLTTDAWSDTLALALALGIF